MIIVPTFQNKSSRYAFDIELNQELFHLVFTFNAREKAWYMIIQNENENNIITGIKMVINYLLLEQYKAYAELPRGDFVIIDTEQNPYNVELRLIILVSVINLYSLPIMN